MDRIEVEIAITIGDHRFTGSIGSTSVRWEQYNITMAHFDLPSPLQSVEQLIVWASHRAEVE